MELAMTKPEIIIERNIPFADGIFGENARVIRLSPEEITPEAMKSADALITRTRTCCDSRLLAGSRCRIVASATIGLDHVDLPWCRANDIIVRNAPGCNAPAVAQYVFASIIAAYGLDLRNLTLGIIGVGHVGSIVERWGRALGLNVLCCDPPRAEAEGRDKFCSLARIAAEADIVTVHTPYTTSGPHPTHHLLGRDFLNSLTSGCMVINSARGPIADTSARLEAIDNGHVGRAVIDCWESEPDIDRQLLEKTFIATPHIAGYSRQGKIRATVMAAQAVADVLGIPAPEFSMPVPPPAPQTVTAQEIASSYDPLADTAMLRTNPEQFEQLRNHYNLRCEAGL